MKTIEYTGIPGAGKSTAFHQLLKEHIGEQDLIAYFDIAPTLLQRSWWGKRLARVLPKAIWAAVAEHLLPCYKKAFQRRWPALVHFIQSQVPDKTHRQWFFSIATRYMVGHLYAKKKEILIFDEGFVHRLHNIYGDFPVNRRDRLIRMYLSVLPHIDVIISLDAGVDDAEERIVQRGHAPRRWNGMTEKQQKEYLKDAAALHKKILAEITRRSIPVVITHRAQETAYARLKSQ